MWQYFWTSQFYFSHWEQKGENKLLEFNFLWEFKEKSTTIFTFSENLITGFPSSDIFIFIFSMNFMLAVFARIQCDVKKIADAFKKFHFQQKKIVSDNPQTIFFRYFQMIENNP
jgi:hypothetical protein